MQELFHNFSEFLYQYMQKAEYPAACAMSETDKSRSGSVIWAASAKAPQNTPEAAPKIPYIPLSADAQSRGSPHAASVPEACTDILPDRIRHRPRADVRCSPYGRGSGES